MTKLLRIDGYAGGFECENEDVSLCVSRDVVSGFSCVFPGWFLLLAVALLAILFLPEYDLCVVL